MICIFIALSPARFPIPSNQRVVSSTMSSIAFPLTGFTSELFASFIYAVSPKPINSIQLPRSGCGSTGISNPFIDLSADPKELPCLPIRLDCFNNPLTMGLERSEVCYLPTNIGPHASKPIQTPPPPPPKKKCMLLTADFFFFFSNMESTLPSVFFLPFLAQETCLLPPSAYDL